LHFNPNASELKNNIILVEQYSYSAVLGYLGSKNIVTIGYPASPHFLGHLSCPQVEAMALKGINEKQYTLIAVKWSTSKSL